MRNMRSPMPIFIFVGLALIAVIGVIILGASATSASIAVNNTSTEPLSTGIYSIETSIIFGFSALLVIVAGYFALKTLV